MKRILKLSGDFTHGRILAELFADMEAAKVALSEQEKGSEEYAAALADYKAARKEWEDFRDGRTLK